MFCLLYPSVCILLLFFGFVNFFFFFFGLGILLFVQLFSCVFVFSVFVSYFVCACASFIWFSLVFYHLSGLLFAHLVGFNCCFLLVFVFVICLRFCLFPFFLCFSSPSSFIFSFPLPFFAEPCGLLGFGYEARVGLNLCCVSSQCRILECQRISSPREY